MWPLSGWMLVWLCVWIKVQIFISPSWCHCHSLSRSSKSILVLPFWCQLTQVVLDKIQEGRKTVVCMCVSVCAHDLGMQGHRLPNLVQIHWKLWLVVGKKSQQTDSALYIKATWSNVFGSILHLCTTVVSQMTLIVHTVRNYIVISFACVLCLIWRWCLFVCLSRLWSLCWVNPAGCSVCNLISSFLCTLCLATSSVFTTL